MRMPGLLLLTILLLTGCTTTCPESPALSTPLETLESYHQAFVCDEAQLEYKCFSKNLKTALGGFGGYSIARGILREQNPWLVRFAYFVDIADHVSIDETIGDGTLAVATISFGDATYSVGIVYEPEYLLHHGDGETTHAYANRIRVRPALPDGLHIELIDPELELVSTSPVRRVELLPRWVIDYMTGIEQAIEQVQSGSGSASPRP